MAIEVTAKAAEQIKELMRKQNIGEGGLRIGVRGGGCSGLLYNIDVESQERPGDKIFETKDRKSTRLNSSHIQKSRMPSSA